MISEGRKSKKAYYICTTSQRGA